MPNGSEWPKISIVTPSYNQGRFIEETIRSVLLQNYPNLEYIIIDGGSTDESVEIIKKYEPWLTYWVSEKDAGQSDAINKGFSFTTGSIGGWLNSDDLFNIQALEKIALLLNKDEFQWAIGTCVSMNEKGKRFTKIDSKEVSHKTFQTWLNNYFAQPSTFWTMLLWKSVGGVDNGLNYTMDIDLWYKFYCTNKPFILTDELSFLRIHKDAKTTEFSSTYHNFIDEYKAWLIDKYIKTNKNEEHTLSLINEFVYLQIKHDISKRIKNHIVLGKIHKFWSTCINPRLEL